MAGSNPYARVSLLPMSFASDSESALSSQSSVFANEEF